MKNCANYNVLYSARRHAMRLITNAVSRAATGYSVREGSISHDWPPTAAMSAILKDISTVGLRFLILVSKKSVLSNSRR